MNSYEFISFIDFGKVEKKNFNKAFKNILEKCGMICSEVTMRMWNMYMYVYLYVCP